jgi:hypothetical protein
MMNRKYLASLLIAAVVILGSLSYLFVRPPNQPVTKLKTTEPGGYVRLPLGQIPGGYDKSTGALLLTGTSSSGSYGRLPMVDIPGAYDPMTGALLVTGTNDANTMGPGIYTAGALGIYADGTDQTAHLNIALTAIAAAGGGTLVFGTGTYVCQPFVIANDGNAYPNQPPLRITGAGNDMSYLMSANGGPQKGTVLRFNGTLLTSGTSGTGSAYCTDANLAYADANFTTAIYHCSTVTSVQHVFTPAMANERITFADGNSFIIHRIDSNTVIHVVGDAHNEVAAAFRVTPPAKILTMGHGTLEVDHLAFDSNDPSGLPCVYTTNTTLSLHNLTHHGFYYQNLANEDFVVFGGQMQVDGTSSIDPEAGFQGYGSVVRECYFSQTRRAVFGRMYANGIKVCNNCIDPSCGANDTRYGAAIVFDGDPLGTSVFASGNMIQGNLIEIGSYLYGINLRQGLGNTIIGNDVYDGSSSTLAAVYLNGYNSHNLVFESFGYGSAAHGYIYLTDDSASAAFFTMREYWAGPPGRSGAFVTQSSNWDSLPTPTNAWKYVPFFCTNGRKSGETTGNGTGIPVWCDGSNWRTYYDDSNVAK